MNGFEAMAIADIVSTLVLEFWASYKSQNPNPMTPEEFATISGVLKERRKIAMAAIASH